MKLRLSSDFAVDTDEYKREGLRFSILAMSGHGKSNAAADIVEDVLEQHGQVIIIEPIPEWHTLKARFNNVIVIGGPYQDIPLEPARARAEESEEWFKQQAASGSLVSEEGLIDDLHGEKADEFVASALEKKVSEDASGKGEGEHVVERLEREEFGRNHVEQHLRRTGEEKSKT